MQNIEKKRNTQNEATNNINLNPSNITKCELVRKDTSNYKTNPPIQQKEHKQFEFIIGDSVVKDIDSYLLTKSINRKFIANVRSFLSTKVVDMPDYIQPTKRDFDPSVYILHIEDNDLWLEDTSEPLSKGIIATAEST